MRKTDKKIDNSLRKALTQVCDIAQSESDGFEWLTHFVNYDRFPNSLNVVCVFDTQANLALANQESFHRHIKDALDSIDIKVKDMSKHVQFDTEENCEKENKGKWNVRFQQQGFQV
ncbi:hypothetical protein K6Q96_19400 [Grimontia kaedaensis]|uniref:Fis family transcriptional regulator n=1 Tax=Grimontia kaedaensis TaxID=2872157 RepID=A0ABY4X281_9GAMM|nr:hypothetical protein [Grimontia kaedaensis]USH05373.1 hypothetical protein K6Q96_19400 [Grimontia kaedaensis]